MITDTPVFQLAKYPYMERLIYWLGKERTRGFESGLQLAGIEVREACFMQCTCACMYFT